MRTLKIVLIRCPQPLLFGNESGALYSPNRSRSPEPTLPQLHGIVQTFVERSGCKVEVTQLDLRDPLLGHVESVEYGRLVLPYIQEPLAKVYSGIPVGAVRDTLESADVVGFTNNFALSRGVVCRYIAEVRRLFPGKEIWVGGRDIFTSRVVDVYVRAAAGNHLVVFHGHVFQSLPVYLEWQAGGVGQPFGVTIYDEVGGITRCSSLPLGQAGQVVEMPLPVYTRLEPLGYFIGSGEGQADPPFGRFVHAMFSIGCPYDCGYCTTGFRERFLVHKGLPTIERELEMYRQMGVTHLAIMDDNLLALGPDTVREIMGIVNVKGFMVEYGNGLQLKLLWRWWDAIAESVLRNCVSFYAPLEDLTQDWLYRKLDPIEEQFALLKRLVDERTPHLKYVTMGVVHGVPGHTLEKLSTVFLQNMERFLGVFQGTDLEVAATVFNFIPLSGTTFGELALDSGRMVVPNPIVDDPEIFSFGTVSYAPDGMTHSQVFEIYERALNLNPAGRQLGIDYVTLQRLGERALPPERRTAVPPNWRTPGYHLRAKYR